MPVSFYDKIISRIETKRQNKIVDFLMKL